VHITDVVQNGKLGADDVDLVDIGVVKAFDDGLIVGASV